jgi:YrbI family 3-deoxy-D-manno-octulosonate 8-phosphate phosphatase
MSETPFRTLLTAAGFPGKDGQAAFAAYVERRTGHRLDPATIATWNENGLAQPAADYALACLVLQLLAGRPKRPGTAPLPRAAELLKPIKLLAFDFDGVMTDNRVLVFEDGREAVLCSRGDGFGFDLLRKIGFPVVVISKEGNPVVTARCRKLKIPCEQGIEDKLLVLKRFAADHRLGLDEVAYMGNDLNDLECMRACGVAIAPADAHPDVLAVATLVTGAPGGFGAVREICDLLVAAKQAAAGPA